MKIEKTPDGYLLSKDVFERIELWRRFDGVESWACAAIDELTKEIEALRAEITEMERQEPVGKFVQHPSNGLWEQDGYGDNPDANPLYALPGAKGEKDV